MKQRVEDYAVTNQAQAEMLSHAAVAVHVGEFPPVISDEPPSHGGQNRGPSTLEYIPVSLCACTSVSTSRMAEKHRFEHEDLETHAEGVLDTRGREGLADVPVHCTAVRLRLRIKTGEPAERLARLESLVGRYCPVDSQIRVAVPDCTVTWERMD